MCVSCVQDGGHAGLVAAAGEPRHLTERVARSGMRSGRLAAPFARSGGGLGAEEPWNLRGTCPPPRHHARSGPPRRAPRARLPGTFARRAARVGEPRSVATGKARWTGSGAQRHGGSRAESSAAEKQRPLGATARPGPCSLLLLLLHPHLPHGPPAPYFIWSSWCHRPPIAPPDVSFLSSPRSDPSTASSPP